MTDRQLSLGGLITFWTLCEWTHRDRLLSGLQLLGLGKYCPEPRTGLACLRDALGIVFKDGKFFIRALKRDGFAVYTSTVDKYKVTDTHVITVLTDAQNKLSFHDDDGNAKYCEQAQAVVDECNRYAGLLPKASVTAALVHMLESLGKWTRLRPSGGFYWLPDTRLDQWRAIGNAVEIAAMGRSNVYRVSHQMDADALRAVTDGIREQITAEATRIEREIQTTELGDKAIESRKHEAARLKEQVKEFEDLLDVSLKDLEAACDRAENAEAMAALVASAGSI
jgi:hypothetical protein